MTFHALTGFMTNITAAEIPAGRLAMTILPTISHPVGPMMGNWFLAAMTIDTITGIMTGGT